MTTPTLTRAAELLECEAAILRESCTDADGEWSDKCELLRTAHAEMLRVAGELRGMLAAAPQPPAVHQGSSPTAGMTLWQRIEHVGGRINAASYVEFGSVMAVDALISHVLRDLSSAPGQAAQPADVARLVDLLHEAATTFRRYESLHRAKGTAESDAKAEVNADIAGRIEAALAAKGGDHA